MSVVVGVGLSSQASAAEVADLLGEVLRRHDLRLADVGVIATRQRFVADPRLQLGRPVVGFSDSDLEQASSPPLRTTGIRAKVAETAARLATAVDGGTAWIVTPVERSAHVTVALARPVGTP